MKTYSCTGIKTLFFRFINPNFQHKNKGKKTHHGKQKYQKRQSQPKEQEEEEKQHDNLYENINKLQKKLNFILTSKSIKTSNKNVVSWKMFLKFYFQYINKCEDQHILNTSLLFIQTLINTLLVNIKTHFMEKTHFDNIIYNIYLSNSSTCDLVIAACFNEIIFFYSSPTPKLQPIINFLNTILKTFINSVIETREKMSGRRFPNVDFGITHITNHFCNMLMLTLSKSTPPDEYIHSSYASFFNILTRQMNKNLYLKTQVCLHLLLYVKSLKNVFFSFTNTVHKVFYADVIYLINMLDQLFIDNNRFILDTLYIDPSE